MKNIIRAEEAALFFLSIYLFSLLGFPWWVFPALLLLPDLSMLGYLAGPSAGAMLYNIVHFRGLGIALYLAGALAGSSVVALGGLILFAHSTLDRAFGYGLKLKEGFKFTHLGNL